VAACTFGLNEIIGDLTTFLKSLNGLIISATGVVTATVALLAALRKLGPIVEALRKRKKREPAEFQTKQSPNRILVGLAIAGVSIAGTALSYGIIFHEDPVVLSGSTNVYAYLRENFPAAFDSSISLTDVGSSEAQHQAFAMFDHGQGTGEIRKSGWLALSSNGDKVLREEIVENKNNPGFLTGIIG
jgi:hypothetical protein